MTESVRLKTFRKLNENYAYRLSKIAETCIKAFAVEHRLLTAEEQEEIYSLSTKEGEN